MAGPARAGGRITRSRRSAGNPARRIQVAKDEPKGGPIRSANAVLIAATVALAPDGAMAQQVPWSQRAEVHQRVAFTDISITYSRPVARGRTLFGGVVRWDAPWNPGADSATTISSSREILVEGQPLPAGRYTLWTIPGRDRWTVIFSRAVDVYHTPYPGERLDALRVNVTPERGDHMETLAFYFPTVERDRAVLRLHWGETVVAIRIEAPGRDG